MSTPTPSTTLKFVAACRLPTEYGIFTLHGFEETGSGQEHIALVMGDVAGGEPGLQVEHPLGRSQGPLHVVVAGGKFL